jgi:DNA-binding NtrC family response regulator
MRTVEHVAVRLLIVDDELNEREGLSQILAAAGHEVKTAGDGLEALEALQDFRASVILTDLKMPRMDGFELIEKLRSEGLLPPTIVLTAFGSLEMAVSTIHDLGGFWFLEKPIDIPALHVLVERAGAHGRLEEENRELRRELSYRGAIGDLVGESPKMREIFSLVRQISGTDAAVLITGESGTGKELVARAIHTLGRRSNARFVAINCAALPESLIESELFGHERGAFTGAADRRLGSVELAHKGTLFLDEIGEMPAAMQAKLLRVLEDFRFRRLGGKQEIDADVRVIAATNRDPRQAIAEGRLRDDLYYRLNVFHIYMPPLRERLDDLPLLAKALIHTLNAKHHTRVTGLSKETLEMLMRRPWKGNVRELRNVLERAAILAGQEEIQPHHVSGADDSPSEQAARGADHSQRLDITIGMTIYDAERALVEATLMRADNNKTLASSILGISAKTMHAKLRRYREDAAKE